MQMVIPFENYSFNAAAKTITLLDPYNTVTVERILSIRNLTKNILIYDSNIPTQNSISVLNGVITHTYVATMANDDKIQIIIDSAVTTSGRSATDHEILAAGSTGIIAGGVAISTINTPLSVIKYSELHLFVGNTGQSTSVTITCRGKPSAASTLWEDLAVLTLGISPTNKAGTCIVDFPAFIYFDVINNDAVNGAAIALTVQGK